MDNLTHSMAGWALGQAGLKTKTRKGLAALILGANMPDLDVFVGWVSWAPLATHRGFTHSVVGGSLVMPPLLAALLWLLDRWQISRGQSFRSGLPMHVGWLLALSYLGALTHPLLDMQTTYAVQLLSPFSTSWFHTETLFIIDIWVWAGLGFAIWLSRKREREGGRWRRPAIIGLLGLCAYVAVNGGISLLARSAVQATPPHATPDVMFASQEPALFWRRTLIWRQHGMIGRARYDPLRSLTTVFDIQPFVPDQMSDPLARRAMTANRDIIQFMRWSTIPMADVERHRCTATVRFSDARFGAPRPGGRFLREVDLALPGKGCPAPQGRSPSRG
ncbi:MAG TPA: metal-dependent hydrolase [Sphingobium sp.]|nr:metal-dependent hydrolase [Sphingobium sp.]